MIYVRPFALVLLALLAIVLLSACNSVIRSAQVLPSSHIAEVVLRGTDHTFEAPEEIPAGRVTLTFRNEGQAPHHAQVARLNAGVSYEQITAAAAGGLQAVMPLLTFYGGPSSADAGETTQATIDLDPGAYVLLCFIPGPDGVAHMAQGMIRPFTVAPSLSVGEASPPPSTQTISLYDFHYAMPESVPAGSQTWQIVNDGPQVHELAIFRLDPGKTIDDFLAFHRNPTGEPPFDHAGGMQFLEPGQTGWVTLDLAPGNYVANCFVPDRASGDSHMELGMVMPFTVVE